MKLDLDIEQFWKDEDNSHKDNCFAKSNPQVAMGLRMSGECVFAELGVEGHQYGYISPERRYELNCRYNEKARQIVGRALLPEDKPLPPEKRPKVTIPEYRQIGEVFGGRYVASELASTWLEGSMNDAEDLAKKLKEVRALISDPEAFRNYILPADWDERCKAVYELYGERPKCFCWMRGPVTLATSVFGAENLLYLFYDDEALFTEFADVIGDVVLAYIELTNREAGNLPGQYSHGFWFYDDDCNLMTPEMYKAFGYRVLKKVFDKVAPNPGDIRYQHSDSSMGHLLPLLADFDLNGCNFGRTVTVREIRKYLPHTRIDGQLAPYTLMRNVEDDIIAEVKRDCEMAKENDLRGLNLSTAGSPNNGSLLTSMRVVMAAIQNYGRY